jgi:hypothetical protein
VSDEFWKQEFGPDDEPEDTPDDTPDADGAITLEVQDGYLGSGSKFPGSDD